MRHCSAYRLGTEDVKRCMADVGVNLSQVCIKALVADGYITKELVIAKAAERGMVVVERNGVLSIDNTVDIKSEPSTVVQPKLEPLKTIINPDTTVKAKDAETKDKPKPVKVSVAKPKPKAKKPIAKKIVDRVTAKFKPKKKKVFTPSVKIVKKVQLYKPVKKYIEHWDDVVVDKRELRSGSNDSDFGMDKPRDPGYSRPPARKSWQKQMLERFENGIVPMGPVTD